MAYIFDFFLPVNYRQVEMKKFPVFDVFLKVEYLGRIALSTECEMLSKLSFIMNVFSNIFRSSHRRCSVKKCVLRNFEKFTGKNLCQRLFFNKVARLRLATLSKKCLWHRCFVLLIFRFETIFLKCFISQQFFDYLLPLTKCIIEQKFGRGKRRIGTATNSFSLT